jgi:dipeptidyl aminopeptidase/acylaminoacyl peptidase
MQAVNAQDLYAIKTLSRPQAAGNTVFFNENEIDETTGEYRSAIYAYNRETGVKQLFGTSGTHDGAPRVSPDGKMLAFTAPDEQGQTQIFTQSVAGGSARQFTHSQFGVGKYDWAADGQGFFYQETRHPHRATQLTGARYTRVQYRFNGKGYLPEDEDYYLMRQTAATQTASEFYHQTYKFGFDATDPSGKYLALHTEADPQDDNNAATDNFFLETASGAATHLQTGFEHGQFAAAAFSADGSRVLFTGEPNTEATDLRSCVFEYDFQTQTFAVAQDDTDVEVGGMVVGDTQQNLSGTVATYLTGTDYLVSTVQAGAVTLVQNADFAAFYTGKMHLTDFAAQQDGSGVYATVSTQTQASRLVYVDAASGAVTELYNPNAAYEQTHTVVTPQEFSFERAGVTLQGWYFAPAKPADQHPAVLYVHGGPHAAYGYTFFHELQVEANLGYGVITLNPRGGASYGNDFKKAVIGDYGGEDFQDLMAACDEAQKLDPTIDPARLYCAGGSYGGFMSNWVETHTNRFAAVATCRSISNWTSFYGTSDIGFSFGPREMEGKMQGDVSDQATLWRFSPLAYVDQAQTPILILHGEEDYRCPIEQGEQFFTSLKLHGVETEFVRFPQSNHELSRSGIPALRIERMQAITDWFDKH